MGVAGRDRSACLATSENSHLLSPCGLMEAMCYQRFYVGNMARIQFIFNRGRVKNLLKEIEARASIRTYMVYMLSVLNCTGSLN